MKIIKKCIYLGIPFEIKDEILLFVLLRHYNKTIFICIFPISPPPLPSSTQPHQRICPIWRSLQFFLYQKCIPLDNNWRNRWPDIHLLVLSGNWTLQTWHLFNLPIRKIEIKPWLLIDSHNWFVALYCHDSMMDRSWYLLWFIFRVYTFGLFLYLFRAFL